jgi:hypothetical protein
MSAKAVCHRLAKQRFSAQEKRDYCIAWEMSGVSKLVFCKANGISQSAFYVWYDQYKLDRTNGSLLAPITIKPSPILKREELVQFEMRLPNQAQLFMTMHHHGLVEFIQELCHAATVIR